MEQHEDERGEAVKAKHGAQQGLGGGGFARTRGEERRPHALVSRTLSRAAKPLAEPLTAAGGASRERSDTLCSPGPHAGRFARSDGPRSESRPVLVRPSLLLTLLSAR